MGKHGPCRHCGVTSTPLWRNGPPEKPVLCNACGSRWRTKGSLTNYTPLHAREPLDSDEFRASKAKTIPFKPKEQKFQKKRPSGGLTEIEREVAYSDQNFRKILEEDISNRSSCGSAISYSESCAHFGTTDASELTVSAQSNVWDSLVPSKKRTCVSRPKPSPVEKLTKDLYSILHEQQSSYLSGSSEEDLLYDSETLIGSVEIGHGGVLIRQPNSKSVEEESEASSFPVDNKPYIGNEAFSGSASFPVHNESNGIRFSKVGTEKFKKSTAQVSQEHAKRDRFQNENLRILRDSDSPLRSIDLQDAISFEVFIKLLTHEEQQRLMKYLPSTDTAKLPESLKTMFSSPQFVEALCCYQQLLLDGVFDLSFSKENAEECKILKRLVLLNSTRSKWVEHYKHMKDVKNGKRGKEIDTGPNSVRCSNLTPLKRLHDSQHQNLQEVKSTIRSPKRASKSAVTVLSSRRPPQLNSYNASFKPASATDDFVDNEGACFSPRTFFASPPDRSSMLIPLQFTDDNSEQDLLLDAPRNTSFPEAELLCHPWNQTITRNTSVAQSLVVQGEESLSNFPSSSFSNLRK